MWLDPIPEKAPKVAISSMAEGDSNGAAIGTKAEEEAELSIPLDDVRRRNPSVLLRRPTDYVSEILVGNGDGAAHSADVDGTTMEVIRARDNVGKEMGLFGYLEGLCLV